MGAETVTSGLDEPGQHRGQLGPVAEQPLHLDPAGGRARSQGVQQWCGRNEPARVGPQHRVNQLLAVRGPTGQQRPQRVLAVGVQLLGQPERGRTRADPDPGPLGPAGVVLQLAAGGLAQVVLRRLSTTAEQPD